jgi:AhpD family alkylhydroperoxidase
MTKLIKQTESNSPKDLVESFNLYRSKQNQRLLSDSNKVMKRIFAVDTMAYQDGALNKETKELLGLVASLVLRCDDCVKYHVQQAKELGISNDALMETFAIANVVGGTIVIPHTRRAVEFMDALDSLQEDITLQ